MAALARITQFANSSQILRGRCDFVAEEYRRHELAPSSSYCNFTANTPPDNSPVLGVGRVGRNRSIIILRLFPCFN